ncbi:MAG: ArnT family glycosyltransferase [Candidatus Woesearchaeota archaeon]
MVIPIRVSYAQAAFVFICVFALSLVFILSADTRVNWDEAVYIGISKHIASEGEYGLFEDFRPFALSLVLAPFIMLGFDTLIAAKLIAIVFSTATLVLTFLLARRLADDRVGLFAVLLVMLSSVFFVKSLRMMTEIPSAFFILLSIYAFVMRKPIASGVFALVSFAFRYPSGLILPSMMLIAYLREGWRSAARVALGFLIAFVPLAIAYALFLEDPVRSFLSAASHQGNAFFAIPGVLRNLLFYPIALFAMQPLFAAAFVARRPRARILLIPIVVFTVYFTFITNKQDRFILVIVPLVSILAACGLASIRRTWIPLTAIGAVGLVIIGPIVVSELAASETPIQSFFRSVELSGPVGTSDPVIVAYRDVLFVPIYFTYRHIERDMEGLDEVLFLPQAYGCSVFGAECESYVDAAYDSLTATHMVVDGVEYIGLEYVLFVRNP